MEIPFVLIVLKAPTLTCPVAVIVKFGAEPVILIPDPCVNPVNGIAPFIRIIVVSIRPDRIIPLDNVLRAAASP